MFQPAQIDAFLKYDRCHGQDVIGGRWLIFEGVTQGNQIRLFKTPYQDSASAVVEPVQIAVICFLGGASAQCVELIAGAVFFNQLAQGAAADIKRGLAFEALGILGPEGAIFPVKREAARHGNAAAVLDEINVRAFAAARCVAAILWQCLFHSLSPSGAGRDGPGVSCIFELCAVTKIIVIVGNFTRAIVAATNNPPDECIANIF